MQQWDAVSCPAGSLAQGVRKKKAEVAALCRCPHPISQAGAPTAPWPQWCRGHDSQPVPAKVTCHLKHFPIIPDHLCLSPWHSSRKALETNTNYPCRCTWRIEAHFAAGAAHFPASVSNSPLPPHWPRSAQVATPPTGLSTLTALPGGVPLAPVSLTSRPAG